MWFGEEVQEVPRAGVGGFLSLWVGPAIPLPRALLSGAGFPARVDKGGVGARGGCTWLLGFAGDCASGLPNFRFILAL